MSAKCWFVLLKEEKQKKMKQKNPKKPPLKLKNKTKNKQQWTNNKKTTCMATWYTKSSFFLEENLDW